MATKYKLGSTALCKADLILVQGVTFGCRFEYLREGDDGAEAPVDMTGWTAYMDLDGADGTRVLHADDAVTLDAEGNVDVGLTPEMTGQLEPGTYAYDILLKDPDGDVYRLAAGSAKVSAKVSEVH